MGWRYRKSFRLFPGVRINVSQRGISTTIGVRGASINFSNRGTYLNTGIPGTGISYRQRIDGPVKPAPSPFAPRLPELPQPSPTVFDIPYYTLSELHLPGAIKSSDIDTLTSEGLQDLRSLLMAAVNEARTISNELSQAHAQIERLQQQELALTKSLFGLGKFIHKKKIAATQVEKVDVIAHENELKEQQCLCTVPVDTDLDNTFTQGYDMLIRAFKVVSSCQAIWDKTSAVANNSYATRSAATTTITRTPVQFTCQDTDLIPSNITPCRLENANGSDIYLYPGFILIYENASSFALIDWQDFEVDMRHVLFIESETIPSDTQTVDQTWQYVNKNGSPDRRFSNNRILPIVDYADIYITTPSGVNEAYCFSNTEKAESFCRAILAYKKLFSKKNC